jgi:CRP/FNR family transcriptional regulator, cyclic AMP receptor protein
MSESAESPISASLAAAGLEVIGLCDDLTGRLRAFEHHAPLVEDLTLEEAAILGAMMPKVRAKAGQPLIREGDLGDWLALILSGTVNVTKASESGEPAWMGVIKFGAAVGEMSMLDGSPRYATCTAIDEVEAGVLTRATVATLIRDHPAIGAKLLVKLTQLLAQRLRNTSNQVVKLVQQGVKHSSKKNENSSRVN